MGCIAAGAIALLVLFSIGVIWLGNAIAGQTGVYIGIVLVVLMWLKVLTTNWRG